MHSDRAQCPVTVHISGAITPDFLVTPGRLERPTHGLGNRCSIRLSYGARLGRGSAREASGLVSGGRGPKGRATGWRSTGNHLDSSRGPVTDILPSSAGLLLFW